MSLGLTHAPRGLTRREIQVLQLIADGRDPIAIARVIGVSAHTVRTHIRVIRERTGTHSRLDAILWGLAAGVVHL
jgi:DNA-binding CsgD family transcriptional regulator